MAKFEPAVEVVLQHEGGYSTNPVDRGGATRFGINERFLVTHGINLDVSDLTLDKAVELYRTYFWKSEYERIENQEIATKVFDLAVNMGPSWAHRILQASTWVKVDGVIGDETIAAVNKADAEKVLREMRAQSALRYVRIVLKDATQNVFLLGWLRRAVA